jgi:hypothetical protein
MSPPPIWQEVTTYYSVLALVSPGEVVAEAFALHVLEIPCQEGIVAWWETPKGLFLSFATVGQA